MSTTVPPAQCGTKTWIGQRAAAAMVAAAIAALPHEAIANAGRLERPLHGARLLDSASRNCNIVVNR